MSPEQAEGKSIDHRSDIFSIGIILYEMATGERPFKGDSSASILSSVIKDTPPPVTELRPELPRDLEKLIRRCLVKDAEGRLQATKDLRNELRESKQDVDSGEAVAGKAVSKPKRTMWPLAVIGAALVGALVFFALDAIRHEAPAIAPSFERLTTAAGVEQAPSISPDGKAIVYVGRESPEDDEDIYYLRVGGQNPTNLTKDSPSNDGAPAFSPDGEKIAFISDRDGGGIFIMGATGESVRRLTDFGSRPAWSPDGSHVLVDTGGGGARSRTGPMSQIWRIDTNTGDKNLVFPGDAIDPYYSPSGTRIVYQAGHDIWTISAEGGEPVQVTQHETMDHQPVWSPDGRLLYFVSNRGGSSNLWRIPIDEQTGRVLGQPEPVTSGGGTPREHPSISADGSKIAYVERLSGWDLHRFSFDPVTAKTRDPLPLVQRKNAYWPDVSPDGEWIVFFEGFRQQQEDIGVIRNDGTAYRKLTDDIHRDRHPRWSPDGKIIAFDSERSGEWQVWTIRFDGSDLTQLTHGAEGNRYPVWSPDGAYLTYQDMANGDSVTIDVVEGAGENPLPNRLRFDEEDARFIAWSWSPDGARLAGWVRRGGRDAGIVTYSRDEGRFEQWTTVGRNPSWLSDGQTILIAGQSLVDGATKQVRELDKAGRHTILGTISPDDKYVYTSIRVMEADIWMLTLNEEQ
jgi:Tol biopolymer transport system component